MNLGITFLLAAHLYCPSPHVKNISFLPWTAVDSLKIDEAAQNCATRYTASPCLKCFYRVDHHYFAICGRKTAYSETPIYFIYCETMWERLEKERLK